MTITQRMKHSRLVCLLTITAASLLLVWPAQAGAARVLDSYCSPSGDFCTSVSVVNGRVRLKIGTFSFDGPYMLCVRGPRNKRCHSFRLSSGDIHSDRVDWAHNFPSGEPGNYHASWRKFGLRLGPILTWTES